MQDLPPFRFLESGAAALGAEVAGIDELDPVPLRESERALADQERVRRTLEHETRKDDRVLHGAQPCHRARVERRAVHDRRIELVLAALVVDRALARVEERRILEALDRVLDHVEGRSTGREHPGARSKHVGKRRADLRCVLLRARLLTAGARAPVYSVRPDTLIGDHVDSPPRGAPHRPSPQTSKPLAAVRDERPPGHEKSERAAAALRPYHWRPKNA